MPWGSRDRLELAYRSIHPSLWRALLAFTGDPDIASDAEAEAFAQVLRRGGSVDDVAAWVWRSSFRIAGGLLATRRRDLRRVTLDDERAGGESSSVVEFLDLLGALSAQQRACVVPRYVGGFTPSEIAAVLATTATTVRVQLHRARASLRTTLEEAGHG